MTGSRSISRAFPTIIVDGIGQMREAETFEEGQQLAQPKANGIENDYVWQTSDPKALINASVFPATMISLEEWNLMTC